MTELSPLDSPSSPSTEQAAPPLTWDEVQKRELEWWLSVRDKQRKHERNTYWEKMKRLGLFKYDPSFEGKTVIDVGAGPEGGIISLLPGRRSNRFVSVDPQNNEYVEYFEREPGIEYLTDRAERLISFENNSVDIVICTCTIDHTEDIDAALCEFQRVLKSSGKLCLHVYLDRQHGKKYHPNVIKFEDVRRWTYLFSEVPVFEIVRDVTGKYNFYGVFVK